MPKGLIPHHFRERILGGKSITISDAPYQIGLDFFGYHRCGGALISEYAVLTAAHCVYRLDPSSLEIRAGSDKRNGTGGTRRKVKSYIIHEKYNNFEYDIAIVKLEKKLSHTDKIKSIGLAPAEQVIEEGMQGFISGWSDLRIGDNLVEDLHGLCVPMITRAKCNGPYENKISEIMICAGNEAGGIHACQGDSGGPLVIGKTLSGITSWGAGCAIPGFPGVYASVAALRQWIEKNMA